MRSAARQEAPCHGVGFGARRAADDAHRPIVRLHDLDSKAAVAGASLRMSAAQRAVVRHEGVGTSLHPIRNLGLEHEDSTQGIASNRVFMRHFKEFDFVPPPCCSTSTPSRAHPEPAPY